jgi:hypothetical protein
MACETGFLTETAEQTVIRDGSVKAGISAVISKLTLGEGFVFSVPTRKGSE